MKWSRKEDVQDFFNMDGFYSNEINCVYLNCQPQLSIHEQLIRELHRGELGGQVSRDKSISFVEDRFY